jgi:glucokinase
MERVTVGVDLGGTKIQAVVIRAGEVAGTDRMLTPRDGDAAAVLEAIASTIHASLESAGATVEELRSVGVGAPGAIDRETGAVSKAANVPGFEDRVELGHLLYEALGEVPVAVGNDVDVGVLGELRRGAGRGYRDLLGVWVGTGVGGGLVLDGVLWRGRGAAGELGHVVVQSDGRRCTCGRRGCLEAYAGRSGMERRARKLVKEGERTSLFEIMERRGRDRLTSGVYAEALAEGDAMTRALVDEAAWALGIALASAQNVLDLEAIVIGGGLGDRLGRPFVERIAEEMTPRLFVRDEPPTLVLSELGDLSGAVGAAVLAGG